MRQFATYLSYASLRAAAREQILERRLEGAVVLAPTRGAADDLVRDLAPTGLAGVHALTLNQLAAILAAPELGARQTTPLSRLSQEALAARVVHQARAENALRYFAPVATLPGFPRALAQTLTEIRLAGIPWRELRAQGAQGSDLAWIAERYAALLAEQRLADLSILLVAAEQVARRGHPWLELPLFVCDVPLRDQQSRAWVQAILAPAREQWIAITSADEESRRNWRDLLQVDPAAREPRIETPNAVSRLQRQLFAAEAAAGPADSSFCLFSQPGEGLESAEIARRIQRLAQSGTPFDRVAIVLRSAERYQPLVEEALRRGSIPAYFSGGTARPDPAGRAFLALLACAMEHCSATRFGEYLSLAQVPDRDHPRAERAVAVGSDDEILSVLQPALARPAPDPDPEPEPSKPTPWAWERLLVDAAVVGGADRWERRLTGLEFEVRQQLRDVTDEGEHARLERRFSQLRSLKTFALPLIHLLDSLPAQASWGVWIARFEELAEAALRQPDTVLGLLRELMPMREVGPVRLAEAYGVLEERLRFLRREPPRRRYGKVFIGTPEEIRAREFDVVFVPGLAEGLFPQRVHEDPLLTDSARRHWPGRLATRDDRVARERLKLALPIAAARQTLVASYPRIDAAQSRPRVPSFYALELVRAAEGELPDLKEFERRAAEAAPVRLGWPAPSDPQEALDDTEYDLASFERYRLAPDPEKGAGRFILDANAIAGRALRTRWKRWSRKWWDADGLVDPGDPVQRLLEADRLGVRPYSATALQAYAACPYRFFLQGVLQLRPREESVPLEQMDPLTRGTLFHEVQEKFIQAFRGAMPFDSTRLPAALDQLDEILDAVAADFAENLAPAIPRVWNTEVEEIRTDLRGWLRHLATVDNDWRPVEVEFPFGRDDTPVSLSGYRVKGRIDLIERHTTRRELRITDHKTGRSEQRFLYVGGGAVLQPVLYALAAEQARGETVHRSRLFYCTQRGEYREIETPLNATARHAAVEVLAAIDHAIASGFLPAAPQKDACKACDFHSACGPYEEIRSRRKDPARLVPLDDLRRKP